MKLGFNFLKGYNYDSAFIKELEIRLQVFADSYLLAPATKQVFDLQLIALMKQGRTLQDARTEALLVPFLNESWWVDPNTRSWWSNVIAKRLCEDLVDYYKSQWAKMKGSKDYMLKSVRYWEPAYCFPRKADLLLEPRSRIQNIEKEVQKRIANSMFRKFRQQQTEAVKKFDLNKRLGFFKTVKDPKDILIFFKQSLGNIGWWFSNSLYSDKYDKVKSAINEMTGMMAASELIPKSTQPRTDKDKLHNPLPNILDWVRQFKLVFSYELAHPEKHKELCEYYHLITDSV